MIEEFSMPFTDRCRFGEGVTVFVWDDIPSKQLTKNMLPDDIGDAFIEMNLRKAKWIIFETYRSPNQPME